MPSTLDHWYKVCRNKNFSSRLESLMPFKVWLYLCPNCPCKAKRVYIPDWTVSIPSKHSCQQIYTWTSFWDITNLTLNIIKRKELRSLVTVQWSSKWSINSTLHYIVLNPPNDVPFNLKTWVLHATYWSQVIKVGIFLNVIIPSNLFFLVNSPRRLFCLEFLNNLIVKPLFVLDISDNVLVEDMYSWKWFTMFFVWKNV